LVRIPGSMGVAYPRLRRAACGGPLGSVLQALQPPAEPGRAMEGEAEGPCEPEEGPALAVEAGSGFACPDCGRQFASAMAVKFHAAHVHGRKRPVHAFVTTSACPACGNDYCTRLRALEHVERGSKVCRQAVMGGGMLPRPPEEVAAADGADQQRRRSARQHGVADLAGPPAPVRRRPPAAAPGRQ
jgi:hypothetical protein